MNITNYIQKTDAAVYKAVRKARMPVVKKAFIKAVTKDLTKKRDNKTAMTGFNVEVTRSKGADDTPIVTFSVEALQATAKSGDLVRTRIYFERASNLHVVIRDQDDYNTLTEWAENNWQAHDLKFAIECVPPKLRKRIIHYVALYVGTGLDWKDAELKDLNVSILV